MSKDKPPDLRSPLTEAQIRNNRSKIQTAAWLAPYAIMSNNAYNREYPIPLPQGWREVANLRHPLKELEKLGDNPGQSKLVGLALAVFEKTVHGKVEEVVVAFRGTDSFKDSFQNFAPFYRNQVKPAREKFQEILSHYAGKAAKITATGHSLGGGLAFHMSFAFPDIEAISFNASPVTKAGLRVHYDNKKTSVWESGEILQIFRNMVTPVRPRWWNVERIEYRFEHADFVNQHFMEDFALNIAKLGAIGSVELQALIKIWHEHRYTV
jgi:hypothetical protein